MKGELILKLLILISHYCNGKQHKIIKRFIYPSGSVLQFAMGLALPATVTGRNIATNSGILINYALPTNVTQLKLPDISTTRYGQEQILNQILIMLKKNQIDDECLKEMLCFMNDKKLHSASIIYELFEIIFQKLIYHNQQLSIHHLPRKASKDFKNCELKFKCNILKYFFNI